MTVFYILSRSVRSIVWDISRKSLLYKLLKTLCFVATLCVFVFDVCFGLVVSGWYCFLQSSSLNQIKQHGKHTLLIRMKTAHFLCSSDTKWRWQSIMQRLRVEYLVKQRFINTFFLRKNFEYYSWIFHWNTIIFHSTTNLDGYKKTFF